MLASFISIDRSLGFAGECTEVRPELKMDDQFEGLQKRYLDSVAEARAVWPDAADTGEIVLAAMNSKRPWPSCRREFVQTALAQAGTALDEHDLLFRQYTAKMATRGAWAGPIQLCRENVLSTAITSTTPTDVPILTVTLVAPLKTTWFDITKLSVGRPIAIRLDGAVIVKPVVNEPIEKGEFQVSGPYREVLNRLAERAAAPC